MANLENILMFGTYLPIFIIGLAFYTFMYLNSIFEVGVIFVETIIFLTIYLMIVFYRLNRAAVRQRLGNINSLFDNDSDDELIDLVNFQETYF